MLIEKLRDYHHMITLFSSFMVAGAFLYGKEDFDLVGALLFVGGFFGIFWTFAYTLSEIVCRHAQSLKSKVLGYLLFHFSAILGIAIILVVIFSFSVLFYCL